jgi:diaminopimelate epimerase
MGQARLLRGEIGMTGPADEEFMDQPLEGKLRGTAVSMGNPHLVIPVPDVAAVDLAFLGPRFEHLPVFPDRVNVHFVEATSRGNLVQRTWERGAGATLACGTGACAVAVAAWKLGLSEPSVDVKLPGGHLQIKVAEDLRVTMTGAAVQVFEGSLPDLA